MIVAFLAAVALSEAVLDWHGVYTLGIALAFAIAGYHGGKYLEQRRRVQRSHQPVRLGRTPSRDRWLTALVNELRPGLERRAELRVNPVSITADPIAWRNEAARGHCSWDRGGAGKPTIQIAPDLEEPFAVAATVVHELLHAGLPAAGHNWVFREAAARVGLKVVAENGTTEPTPAFEGWVAPLLDRLGPYPGTAEPVPARPVSLPVQTGRTVALLIFLAGLATAQLAGPFTRVVPVLAVVTALAMACGLTDSYFARQPLRRIGLQLVLLLGPGLIGLLLVAPLLTQAAATHGAPALLPGFGGRPQLSFWEGVLNDMGDASRAYHPHTPLVLALWVTYALLGPLLAIRLWRDRPTVRYYTFGSFRGATPPFARAPWDRRALGFLSRSNPAHVGHWLALVELAARGERARRGLDVHDLQEQLEAELIPDSGFVIERHGNMVEVAAGTAGEVKGEEATVIMRQLRGLPGQPGRTDRPLLLMRPEIMVVRDDEAVLEVRVRRGVVFASLED